MLWTNIKRVSRLGFVNFWRNGYVSLASVLIMTLTLLVGASLLLSRAVLESTLTQIRDKVDINVYFTTSADEENILALKERIEALPEVQSAVYSSREDELEKFIERHQNDELTLQALDEVGGNPLGAALEVKAKDPSQYEGVAAFLENQRQENPEAGIDKINYSRNKAAIESLSRIMNASEKLGFAIAVVFIAIAILITFNTIRLTIYMAREEISIMRLVGASTRYIKGPFVVSGIIGGVGSAIIATILLVPLTYWVGPYTYNLGTGINLFSHYLSNGLSIFFVLLLSGLVIGAVSSYLAVKKYLKI